MLDQAFKKALEVREHAYCPYSKFQVGAVVKAQGSDQLFAGCNVENSSYGATICAERNAIWSMVAELGSQKLEFVLLVTDAKNTFDTPCAMCLQVMSEFAEPHMPVHLCNLEGLQKTMGFQELLPRPFDKSSLGQ